MILYKYMQPARMDVLQQRRIRFTQPGDFNDPFEFRPLISAAASEEKVRRHIEENFERLVIEELNKYGALAGGIPKERLTEFCKAQKPRLPELYRALEGEMLGKVSLALDGFLNNNVGVLCLSEVRDSILMWGHYTENHRGFVIGFDSDHPFFLNRRTEADEFGFLRRVDYQLKRPKVLLSDTTSEVWFQTKSEVWSYEKEWRVVRVLSEADSRLDASPFPICLFEFPSDAVLEVIIGMRASPSSIASIRQLAKQFVRARLLKAREETAEYALIIDSMA